MIRPESVLERVQETPPQTSSSKKSKRSMFGGLGNAVNMIEHLKDNFRNAFAKKTSVEELEKDLDIVQKLITEDEAKKSADLQL